MLASLFNRRQEAPLLGWSNTVEDIEPQPPTRLARIAARDRIWLTAAPTPFAEDGIAEDAFARYVAWQIDEGCGGLVVGGALGEGATLSRRERLRLIEIAVETASSRAVVVAATGTNCTRESIERTRSAQRAGASAALLATPYYNKPKQRGLLRHFQEIAQAVDLPLVIEIDPARTAVDIGSETLAQLAEIPNIAAIAHADGGSAVLRRQGHSAEPGLAHLCGSDGACAQFCVAGGSGWISSTANIVPALWAALQRAIDAKRWDRAMLIEMALQPLTSALQRELGAAPLKYALSLLHPWFSPQVRLPLTLVASETAREIRACFARF